MSSIVKSLEITKWLLIYKLRKQSQFKSYEAIYEICRRIDKIDDMIREIKKKEVTE